MTVLRLGGAGVLLAGYGLGTKAESAANGFVGNIS
jgi:hypothetical protein